MKALVYTAPERLDMQNLPTPEAGPEEVLVRVASCGICGSDIHGFLGNSRIRVPPAIMGHEFVGQVEAIGAGVAGLSRGDRVAVQPLIGCGMCRFCRAGRSNICPHRRLIGAHLPGGFADFVAVPAKAVYPIPDALCDTDAALAEPLANALHMLGLGRGGLYGNVVILGAGTLGLLSAAAARLAGARHVVVTDTQPRRLETARQMGADITLEARKGDLAACIAESTSGGADLVLEAVGIEATRRQAIEVAAPGGTVVFLGNAEPESRLPLLDLVNREIEVRGSYSCTDEEFRRAIAMLSDGRIATDGWIEETGLDRGQEVFERLVRDRGDLVKVMFRL